MGSPTVVEVPETCLVMLQQRAKTVPDQTRFRDSREVPRGLSQVQTPGEEKLRQKDSVESRK